MMTIVNKLTQLNTVKTDIASAITTQGGDVSNKEFDQYAPEILALNSSVTSGSRPCDWLPIPTLVDGDDKIIMLIAVYDNTTNFVAFTVWGDYTIDWGDGTAADNVLSGVKAERNLDFTLYGSATETEEGFRQALVTITPQSGGSLTKAYLSDAHSSGGTYYSQTLEVVVASSSITNIRMYGAALSSSLYRFVFIGTCNLTDASYMFRGCTSLVYVDLSTSTLLTTTYQMFFECESLRIPPLFSAVNNTDTRYMFHSNTSQKILPNYDFTV